MSILNDKLKKRGIRGLMNLHKQFLLSCSNLGTISYGDFIKVMKLQKIDLKKEDYDFIFDRFKQNSKNQVVLMKISSKKEYPLMIIIIHIMIIIILKNDKIIINHK